MVDLTKFIATVYLLVTTGRWAEFREYVALIRELLNRPTAEIIAGTATDKEVK